MDMLTMKIERGAGKGIYVSQKYYEVYSKSQRIIETVESYEVDNVLFCLITCGCIL